MPNPVHSDRLISAPEQAPGHVPEDIPNVVTINTLDPSRELLRARNSTKQAGFTSERIPDWLFRHRPILFDDGPSHDAHRRTLARFFAPKVLETKHREFIEQTAKRLVNDSFAAGPMRVDDVALLFSVEVTSRIVGLTHSQIDRLAERLTRFFRQPPVVHTRPDHGRTNRQWANAAKKALGPLISLYVADVRPAIRARKNARRDDVISYLLDEGYRPSEILMECLTYGTAGMVTTREFICVALWHLLRNDALRDRYVVAEQRERTAILNEIIRLEPPVGHIYRRVTREEPSAGCPYPKGTLVDIDVRTANVDPAEFATAEQLCPARGLPAAQQAGLSFGDGEHRCPGQPLALLETDILLLEILQRHPRTVAEPRIDWDTLIEGYQVRGFTIDV